MDHPEPDSYGGAERRHRDRPYDGPDRRVDDRQDEQLRELAEKLDELESKVDQIAGRQEVLMALARGIDGKTDRLASIKTLLAIVLPVVGSILVALIGGYFVLKAGAPTVVK